MKTTGSLEVSRYIRTEFLFSLPISRVLSIDLQTYRVTAIRKQTLDQFGALNVCLDAIEDLLMFHLAHTLGLWGHWLPSTLRLDCLMHIWVSW